MGQHLFFWHKKTGAGWLNIFGLILVVLLLIPNIIYAIKNKDQENICTNKVMNDLLVIFAVVFGIGHIYVTNKNRV